MSILHETNYKAALKRRLLELKSQSRSCTFQNLAVHCRIQKTYLSKVFNTEKAHLSSDQLFLAAQFLGFNSDEQRYLFLLHEQARTIIPERKRLIESELENSRKSSLKTEKHIDAQTIRGAPDEPDLSSYYLDANCQLVHMFLSLEKYQKHPHSLKWALGLTDEGLSQILRKLLQLKIIEFSKGKFEVLRTHLHLSSDSPLISPYKTLLRLKGLERVRTLPLEKSYNYSVIFTASQKDKKIIQQSFLEFLKKFDKVVKAAPSEEVFQLNFDLFDWTD